MLFGVGTDVVRSLDGCCSEFGRMLSGAWTDVVRRWNGCCPEFGRMLFGVGTDVVRSSESRRMLAEVSPCVDWSFAVC